MHRKLYWNCYVKRQLTFYMNDQIHLCMNNKASECTCVETQTVTNIIFTGYLECTTVHFYGVYWVDMEKAHYMKRQHYTGNLSIENALACQIAEGYLDIINGLLRHRHESPAVVIL